MGAAGLWNRRRRQVRAAGVSLTLLRADDDRLHAHMVGLRLGGAHARAAVMAAFASTGFGEVFPAAVLAVEQDDVPALMELGAIVRSAGELEPALTSAFEWNEPASLRGLAQQLFRTDGFWQRIMLAACGKHRVNPASWLAVATASDDPRIRAIACRVAGEAGAGEMKRSLTAALSSDDEAVRFWTARSATLLGDRGAALGMLETFAVAAGPFRHRALHVFLRAVDLSRAHAFLTALAQTPTDIRLLITAAGIVGDPQYVPWLIQRMEDETLARVAGESFGLITGVDFNLSELERPAPEPPPVPAHDAPENATLDEDPGSDAAAADEDDGLPWPDAAKVRAWWDTNRGRFERGTRYLMGAPVSRATSLHVLRSGHQRQRMAAAHHLCILEPGTALFNTSAPAWRQQKQLAQMS